MSGLWPRGPVISGSAGIGIGAAEDMYGAKVIGEGQDMDVHGAPADGNRPEEDGDGIKAIGKSILICNLHHIKQHGIKRAVFFAKAMPQYNNEIICR